MLVGVSDKNHRISPAMIPHFFIKINRFTVRNRKKSKIKRKTGGKEGNGGVFPLIRGHKHPCLPLDDTKKVCYYIIHAARTYLYAATGGIGRHQTP